MGARLRGRPRGVTGEDLGTWGRAAAAAGRPVVAESERKREVGGAGGVNG